MFTTTKPLTLAGGVVVNQARVSSILFAENNPNGTLSDSITMKTQRMITNSDGTFSDSGGQSTVALPNESITKLSPAVTTALANFKTALDALAVALGA